MFIAPRGNGGGWCVKFRALPHSAIIGSERCSRIAVAVRGICKLFRSRGGLVRRRAERWNTPFDETRPNELDKLSKKKKDKNKRQIVRSASIPPFNFLRVLLRVYTFSRNTSERVRREEKKKRESDEHRLWSVNFSRWNSLQHAVSFEGSKSFGEGKKNRAKYTYREKWSTRPSDRWTWWTVSSWFGRRRCAVRWCTRRWRTERERRSSRSPMPGETCFSSGSPEDPRTKSMRVTAAR